MKSLIKLITIGTFLFSSVFAQASTLGGTDGAKLKFINETGKLIKVRVNYIPGLGVDIPAEGIELEYSLLNTICMFTKTNCHTDYYIDDAKVAESDFNVIEGKLNAAPVIHGAYEIEYDADARPLTQVLLRNKTFG